MALPASGMSGAIPCGRDAPCSYRRSAKLIFYLEERERDFSVASEDFAASSTAQA